MEKSQLLLEGFKCCWLCGDQLNCQCAMKTNATARRKPCETVHPSLALHLQRPRAAHLRSSPAEVKLTSSLDGITIILNLAVCPFSLLKLMYNILKCSLIIFF